jgi:hypothetical protein
MSGDKVTLNDLLEGLDANEFGDMKRLAAHSVAPIQESSQLSAKRANPSTAFDVAKGSVSAWAPVVREGQSQRTVTFDTPGESVSLEPYTAAPTALGSEIGEILKQEKLTRSGEQTLEDDAVSHVTEEEMR